MLKIGVGPSSSHTLGPWRAANRWIKIAKKRGYFKQIDQVTVNLYGSLSLTGKGHATDIAVLLGLCGFDPVSFPTDRIEAEIALIKENKTLALNGERPLQFDMDKQIVFNREFLPFHPNGIEFIGLLNNGKLFKKTFYSIGGGFVVEESRKRAAAKKEAFSHFPYPIQRADELLQYCQSLGMKVSEVVYQNELSLRSPEQIDADFKAVWDVMLESMYIGCHTEGVLPGGLNVRRRAYDSHKKLIRNTNYSNPQEWIAAIRDGEVKFREILKWVSCFALAVNEVNASLGRVVTAPTNGSAGVIPAVLMYYMVIENHDANFDDVKQFLLVAGEIGSLFKKGATISAAMGGCQAEIGVSSAMAAGALTEIMGGSPEQVLMASEIAMEHHLGLTCDPIAGLVQVPCIERNSMGSIKAIHAAEIALETNPKECLVHLDNVIDTMWETAKDMNKNYKETSEGGLAVTVRLADC